MFGSLVTIGAMIAAFTSGRIADFIGRKGVCEICEFTGLALCRGDHFGFAVLCSY